MAIYNLKMEPDKDRSPLERYDYVLRLGKYSPENNKDKYDDFLYGENINMPSFAKENPREFWESCEGNERLNANHFRTIDFSLATELTDEENIELANNFSKELFGDKYVYSLAIHSKPSKDIDKRNIHCHIMFSERELDGIERDSEQFFSKSNSKNPSKGGCKKSDEWNKYSKLYYVRQTWETMLNEKLQEKNIELVSCKSLKAQRMEALAEGNYLKAEMLDRPAINIDKSYMEYAPLTSEKEKRIEFFNYTRELKKLKEKEFKLKSENFEEENLKARERYFRSLYNKNQEEEECISSNFDMQEKEIQTREIEAEYNYENIFIKSLENNILLNKKEERLKQIESITDEDIEARALSILTNKEYKKNEEQLREINELYNQLTNKENFPYEERRKELEQYFINLKTNEYFQEKLNAMKENIKEKYALEKEEIFNDLQFLRNNKFKDAYKEKGYENVDITRKILSSTLEEIGRLKKQKLEADKKVKEYKEKYLTNIDYKEEIYRKIKPEAADKYLELKLWKEEAKGIVSLEDKIEITQRIHNRELGLRVFNIENQVNEKIKEEIELRRKEYKELRQNQDDIKGKLSYSYLMLKELKVVKEFTLLEEERYYQNQLKELENTEDKLSKLEFNTKIYSFNKKYKKTFGRSTEISDFDISFTNEEKKFYRELLSKKIEDTKLELERLKKNIKDETISEKEIRVRILDEKTNGEYSRDLSLLEYYKERKENGLKVVESNYQNILYRVKLFEQEYKINSSDIELVKQLISEENRENINKIREKTNDLIAYCKMLKKLKITNLSNGRRNNIFYPPKKLKVAKTGKIEFEDEREKRRRGREWERD